MTDILFDNEDLYIENGDIVVGESDLQHQYDILSCCKGGNKEFPTSGCGIDDWLNEDDSRALLTEIRQQMSKDGVRLNMLQYNNGTLNIEGHYI